METKTPLLIKVILVIGIVLFVVVAYFVVDKLFGQDVEAPNISVNLPKLKAYTVCQSGTCFDTDVISLKSSVIPGCIDVENGIVCGNFTVKGNLSSSTNASSTKETK